MNYFLDEAELELKDQNFYTAIESLTIIPVFGKDAFKRFWKANDWTFSFFPNFDTKELLTRQIKEEGRAGKKLFEYVLSGRLGNWVNRILFGIHRKLVALQISEKRLSNGIFRPGFEINQWGIQIPPE